MVLKTVTVEGYEDDIGLLVYNLFRNVPPWFLHGITYLTDIEREDGTYRACIWGEGKFWEDSQLQNIWFGDDLSEVEKKQVLQGAALEAIRICTTEELVKKFGGVLLNKHPECREAEDEYSAIIKAALKERMDTFTEEMYEIF